MDLAAGRKWCPPSVPQLGWTQAGKRHHLAPPALPMVTKSKLQGHSNQWPAWQAGGFSHSQLPWFNTAKEVSHQVYLGQVWLHQSNFCLWFVCFLSPSYSRCVHFSFEHLEISGRERLYSPCSGQNHRHSDTLNGQVGPFSAAATPAAGSAPPHPLSHQTHEVRASTQSALLHWSCAREVSQMHTHAFPLQVGVQTVCRTATKK